MKEERTNEVGDTFEAVITSNDDVPARPGQAVIGGPTPTSNDTAPTPAEPAPDGEPTATRAGWAEGVASTNQAATQIDLKNFNSTEAIEILRREFQTSEKTLKYIVPFTILFFYGIIYIIVKYGIDLELNGLAMVLLPLIIQVTLTGSISSNFINETNALPRLNNNLDSHNDVLHCLFRYLLRISILIWLFQLCLILTIHIIYLPLTNQHWLFTLILGTFIVFATPIGFLFSNLQSKGVGLMFIILFVNVLVILLISLPYQIDSKGSDKTSFVLTSEFWEANFYLWPIFLALNAPVAAYLWWRLPRLWEQWEPREGSQ